ncbi:MAG TPA: NAD-dependent epimerase/dehydratase family protein [Rhizomicrobium sp.]|jgi:UDP-glucuronate 4-epimerase|nr:NAD-dependent epimerase/dehydratase family protein [Rhizomicrobium sp.]
MRVLLTGSAGFIGYHAARALLERGHAVTGVDALNAYYTPRLKEARLARLDGHKGFRFVRTDIADAGALAAAAGNERYEAILHLAAQAGVRHALTDPASYTRSNLVGHQNVLEFARRHEGLAHLVYASSSSVYGNDSVAPFREDARADKPVSYYGATKRAGELLSHSYAELFGLKQTGLRFFTVYGPFGRPDMAYWSFTDKILKGEALPVFGGGKLRRDFTYIDDIVTALVRIVETPFAREGEGAPHRIYNLGNSHPEDVLTLIGLIEKATGKKARIEDTQGPPGDVRETYADISRAARDFDFAPRIPLSEGIPRFVEWFQGYNGSVA